MMVFVGCLLVLFSALTVVVQDGDVKISFGPGVVHRRIPLTRICGVSVVETPWYYGWGIRLTPWGWLWRVYPARRAAAAGIKHAIWSAFEDVRAVAPRERRQDTAARVARLTVCWLDMVNGRHVFCVLGLLTVSGALAVAAGSQTSAPGLRLLTDFTSATADFGWYVVNDTVMGGRSQGGFEPGPDGVFFVGSTNTNGGGFSSIRTRDLTLDLSAFAGLRVHVKADGRRYTWRLTTDARSGGRIVSYWADFETVRGEWRDVPIPFSSFRPTFRGSDLGGPVLDPGRISGMGLMIYDGQDGPFQLRIDRVEAYTTRQD